MKEAGTVVLDVRAIFEAMGSPLSAILDTVAALKEGENLRLIVPFEPLPLYDLMEQKGFTHVSRALDDGSWEVLFRSEGEGDGEL